MFYTGAKANIFSNRAPLVKNPQIQSATLHNPLPLYAHLYVWPFLLIWPVFLAFYLSEERYQKYIEGPEWTFVWAGSIITLQSLTWLTTKWNVNFDALFTTTKAKDVLHARLIKVVPVTNAGSAEICTILKDTVCIHDECFEGYLLIYCTDWGEEQHLLLVPETTIPVRL